MTFDKTQGELPFSTYGQSDTSGSLNLNAKNRGGRKQGVVKAHGIINTAAEISMNPPQLENTEWGAKCLVSASLPLRAPKPEHLHNGCWIRKNGDHTLWVQGGPQGLPFGAYPRLFMIWLTSEAIRTGNRRIETGKNFADFFRKIGVDTSRGKNGAGRRLIHQISLLIQSRAAYTKGDIGDGRMSGEFLQFTEKFNLFFDPCQPNQANLFESEILLTEQFFREITTHSIPLDSRAVAALRQSALQLDIYQWLAYRMFGLRAPAHPTWKQLYQQFGSQTRRLVDFRVAFTADLQIVKQVYPNAKITATKSGLILYPSPPPISPKRVCV